MYNIGDKFTINSKEYTIWLIDGQVYHLIDIEGNGLCCEEEYITINAE
jgi:hypothetical protein